MNPRAPTSAIRRPRSTVRAWLRSGYQRLDGAAQRHRLATIAVVGLLAAAPTWLIETAKAPMQPNVALGNGVSAVIAAHNGRGLRVDATGGETWAAVKAGRNVNLLTLYRPAAPRRFAKEPLPGVALPMLTIANTTGELRLRWIVWAQIFAFALSAMVWAAALWPIDRVGALLAAAGWALCPAAWLLVLTPGYDGWTAAFWMTAAATAVGWANQRSWTWALATGLVCAAGLWVRSYFVLLPAAFAVVWIGAAWLQRAKWSQLAALLVPVIASMATLALMRPQADAGARMTRGAFWHTFWAGVGQFDNRSGVINYDASVRSLVQRLDKVDQRSGGLAYRQHDYQYGARYNALLAAHARDIYAEDWPQLVRNAAFRSTWLVLPGLVPAASLGPRMRRFLAVAGSVVLALLAFIGARSLYGRHGRVLAVIAASWAALWPLCAFFVILKVLVGALFAPIALAAFGLAALWRYVAELDEVAA